MTEPDVFLDIRLVYFKKACQKLGKTGMPWTSEDARAMATSSIIDAEHTGWRPPVGEPDEEGAEQPPPPEATTEASSGSYGDYHKMMHVASQPSKGLLHGLIKRATATLTEGGTPAREAETTVKKKVRDAFEEEWSFTPDLTSLNNTNQGQVSWSINYVQTEWGVE